MTDQELRPMDAELEGYAWIPRMIDKARAARAGSIGDYLYPCPIDRTCLRRLGLGAETFADIASTLVDDEGVLAELRRRGIPTATQAWFDPVALEHELCA
jgi:hypothetical protein